MRNSIRMAAARAALLACFVLLAGCVRTYVPDVGAPPAAYVPEEVRNELLLLGRAPQPQPDLSGRVHVVARGETLYGIARAYGVSATDLVRWNPQLSNPRELSVGAKLNLSEDGPVKAAAAALPAEPPAAEEPAPKPGTVAHPLPPRSRAGYIWPARGRVILQYGDPIPGGGGVRSHGIGISTARGAHVLAAKAGRAYVAERLPGFGRTVIVEHADGLVTLYGNNLRVLASHGATVQQGEVIALAGGEGRVAGARLVFMMTRGGRPVDPVPYLP